MSEVTRTDQQPDRPDRDALLRALSEEVRLAQNATDAVDEAVTQWLGLNRTDGRCLDIVERHGRVTAGRLAEEAHLTSGSATAMVDRLEKAGVLRRVRDESDRRRVFVELTDAAREATERAFGPLARAGGEALARYTDEELATILDFQRASRRLNEEHVEHVRALPPWRGPGTDGIDVTVPRGSETSGTLSFPTGAVHLAVRADDAVAGLARLSFTGRVPEVGHDGGHVTARYGRGPSLRRRSTGDVVLSPAVPWDLTFGRGAAHVDADLADLDLRSVAFTGGLSHVQFTLPRPRGVVPVTVTGGMSHVALTLPDGVAASVRIRGGASGLQVGQQRFGAVGGNTELTTGDVTGPDRYEVEVRGGASNFTVAASDVDTAAP